MKQSDSKPQDSLGDQQAQKSNGGERGQLARGRMSHRSVAEDEADTEQISRQIPYNETTSSGHHPSEAHHSEKKGEAPQIDDEGNQ